MKVTEFTRRALVVRREIRDLKAAGWDHLEGPWQILRGGRQREEIVEVRIDAQRKGLWVRTATV
jgi:hypothetical protein